MVWLSEMRNLCRLSESEMPAVSEWFLEQILIDLQNCYCGISIEPQCSFASVSFKPQKNKIFETDLNCFGFVVEAIILA